MANISRQAFAEPVERAITGAILETASAAAEMTVHADGLRVLGAKAAGLKHGVFTKTPGQ